MKWRIIILCLALSIAVVWGQTATNPTLHDIITDIQKNLNRPPVTMEVQTITYRLDPNGIQPPRALQMIKVNYRKDGQLVDIITNRYAPDKEEKFVSDDFSTRHFCNNEYSFSSQNSTGHQMSIFQTAQTIQKAALFNLSNILDGYFNHNNSDGHWTEIFQKEPDKVVVADTREKINGSLCIVIKADTSCGDYTLWLDPRQKFTLCKAHILIDPNDRVWGKPLKESSMRLQCYGPDIRRHYQTMEILLDNIKTEVIDGFIIPVEGIYTEHWTFDDGHRMDNQYQIRRSNIIFNPDFKSLGAFEMDMPEGTVFREDLGKGNYKKYTWSQGKMVPEGNN